MMQQVLEVDAVQKVYGEVTALAGIDLEVGRGEVVALLGPNGAGKTTTFELLLGLAHPTSGHLRVLGAPPGGRVRARMGAMLQGAGLPEHIQVAELVRLIGRSYPAALPVKAVLERVALGDRADRTVTALSGGERQRLLLALALVSAPELLLLDEPTAAMDVASRRTFWDHARASVDDGATLLFATHDLQEADAIADRVVVLADGRVIADTTPAGLKQLVATKVLRVTTDAPIREVVELPGVDRVEADRPAAGTPSGSRRLVVHATSADDVLAALLAAGYLAADLMVTDAGLEEAFLSLTDPVTLSTNGADR